jgi:hypothetical protein
MVEGGIDMANTMPDVHGRVAYRNDRDAKMYDQFTKKKMSMYSIAVRWCINWHAVKDALEREAKRRGEEIDLKNECENRKKRNFLYGE